MSKQMKITQALVQELVHYNPRMGTLTWKPRARRWFGSDSAWKRWNSRYAGQPAFTYEHGGYRWGSVLNKNQLAHRIVWMHVHGRWPSSITFKDGDATNLKLSNLTDRAQPLKVRAVRVHLHQPRERERVRLAA